MFCKASCHHSSKVTREDDKMQKFECQDLFIKRNMILYKIGTLILFSSLCCRNRIQALNILQSFAISVRWRFSTLNLWCPVVWPLKVLRFIIPHISLLGKYAFLSFFFLWPLKVLRFIIPHIFRLGKYASSFSAISLLGC